MLEGYLKARLESKEVQMEAIRYFAEIIACLVLWIGLPAIFTLIGGVVLRQLYPSPADPAT
jgi:hypothetical protein